MNKLFFLMLLALTFSACERDQEFITRANDEPLLAKVLIDGEVVYEYIYTDANQITEEKSRFFYTKHTYNARGVLTKSEFYIDPAIFSSSSYVLEEAMKRKEWVNAINTEKSLTKTYDYDDQGQVTRIHFIRPSSDIGEYLEYARGKEGITRQTMYRNNIKSGYIDYMYDECGNLKKETKYFVLSDGTAELQTTTEYEYDSMKNPYQAFSGLTLPGRYTNPNNIIKETYTLHFDVDAYIEKVQTSTKTYKYNKEGYPVEVNGEAVYVYN